MWADLRAKYAGSKHTGEPQLSQGTYSDGVQQGPNDKNEPEGGNPLAGKHGSVEERVTQFYEVFLPSKLSKLSKILFRYKGKEAQLLEDMRAKYGGQSVSLIRQEVAEKAGGKAEMEASGDYGEGGAKEQVPALPVGITVWVGNAVYGVAVSVVVWAHSLHHSGKSLCEESVSSAEGWLYTQTPHRTGDQ
mgnify:CR=1 FL=1